MKKPLALIAWLGLIAMLAASLYCIIPNKAEPIKVSHKGWYNMEAEDKYWAALAAYHEARGEGLEAIIGVVQVVFNRMVKHGESAAEVVFKPYQFSWANGGGQRPPIAEYHSFLKCLMAADMAMDRRGEGDSMSGATHFHDISITPAWAGDLEFVGQIGNLRFYRED